jgi:uroporphyrinogen-III synthase
MLTNVCRQVIITRPEKQALIWAKKLETFHIDSTIIPLLEIKSFTDVPEWELVVRPIKNCVLNLDLYQKIIFVSQNAVEHGMEWIDAYWPQIPMGIDFFAVGETTAKILREYGVSVQDLAETSQGSMTSESLLLAPGLQQVTGDKILIFRGIGGRGHLAEELMKRGASVEYCEVYERKIPQGAKAGLIQNLKEAVGSSLLTFHSGETLQNFLQLMNQIALEMKWDLQECLGKLSVLVPSVRIEEQARNSGFAHTVLAANATDEAMTEAVIEFFRSKQRDGN